MVLSQSYRRLGLGLLAGTLSIAAIALSGGQASAQSSEVKSIKVSPVRSELTIESGKSAKVSTYVTNTTDKTVTYKVVENDFVAGDDDGNPSIILDENAYAPTHSLKRFMKPVSNVTVGPKATQQVDVTIDVPKTAQAGGYFGAIRFVAGADGGAMVNLNPSATSLVLVTVPGDLVETLMMTNFDITQSGNTASSFRTPDNIELFMRYENTGNVQVAPFGRISVLKDDKVVYATDFNNGDPRSNILPDSSRKWTIPLKNFGKFGKYTIHGTFSYGTENKTLDITKTVWIVPTLYIIFGLVGIGVLLLIIVLIVMLIRAKRGGSRRVNRRF